jgi:oligopeptide/dipeptide ABC transporter ATP-binding protein
MTLLLEARNISKVFTSGAFARQQRTLAVDRVTLNLSSGTGSIIALAGESGSGKTTLGRILLGLESPTQGEVAYRGNNIAKLGRRDRKEFRREVQAIFQDPFAVYNPFYKIDHIFNVAIGKYKLASSKDEARHLVEQAIEAVGLRPEETLGRFPHQLSGGQRQRIIVARVFLLKPKIVIADEPVSMVDASLRATILEALRELHRTSEMSILYITHDLNTAYQVADNIMIMYRGNIVEAGDVEQVINQPEHPYTQLLVNSIPPPDPAKKWVNLASMATPPFRDTTIGQGMCKFVDRCSMAVEECTISDLPFYRTSDKRITRCLLYGESSRLPSDAVLDY